MHQDSADQPGWENGSTGGTTRPCIEPSDTRRRTCLLVAMTSLQVLWLAGIWLTGAASDESKLLPLLIYSLVCGLVVGLLPPGFVARLKRLKEWLMRDETRLVALLCTVTLATGAVYAYDQIGWSDEEFLLAASKLVADEGLTPFFVNYAQLPWLGQHHPPLVPLIYGLATYMLGADLHILRLVSLGFGVATTVLTYCLGKRLYSPGIGGLAACLWLSFPYFFRVGAAAMLDMQVTFFFLLALVLTLVLLRVPTYRLALAIGLVIGAGLLSKYTMILVYPVLVGSLALTGASRAFRRLMLHGGIVGFISASMLGAWLIYAFYSGVLALQIETLTRYAGATVRGYLLLPETLFTRLPSALGTYNLPLLVVGGVALLRAKGRSDRFVLFWIAAVFLPLLLTLPDPRYFMPAFPALALMMARGLESVAEATEQVVALALLHCGGALYLLVDWQRTTFLFL